MTPPRPAHSVRAGRPAWLAARTLRGRLIAGLVALLALACATVGVGHLRRTCTASCCGQLDTAADRRRRPLPRGCSNEQTAARWPARRTGRPHGDDRTRRRPGAGQPASAVLTRQRHRRGDIHERLPRRRRQQPSACYRAAAGQRAIAAAPVGRHRRPSTWRRCGDYRVVAGAAPSDGDLIVTGLPLADVSRHAAAGSRSPRSRCSPAVCCSPACSAPRWVRLSLRPLRRVAPPRPGWPSCRWTSGEVELAAAGARRHRPAHRGRPGRRGASTGCSDHVESALARRAGERAAAAPLRRRRQPRAAHPAGRHPRLRRAGPAQPRSRCRPTSRTRWAGSSPSRPG